MPKITWTLPGHSQNHTVELIHGTYRGQRQVYVDGSLVDQGRQVFDRGSRHVIHVEDEEYEVDVLTNGISFDYYLIHNNLPIPSDQDCQKRKTTAGLLQDRYFRDLALWLDLAKELGLEYRPEREADWVFRHRLVGFHNGYLVVVKRALSAEFFRPGVTIIVRHSPAPDPEMGKQLYKDSRVTPWRGNLKKSNKGFGAKPDVTGIFLPDDKKDTSHLLAEKVRTFTTLVAEYAGPLVPGKCENEACKTRLVRERQLVFINGVPWLFCPECIATIPGMGGTNQKNFESTPQGLWPGLIAGFGIAILGAVAFAAAALAIGGLAVLVPGVVLSRILKAIYTLGAKASLRSIFAAVLLTLFSAILGIFGVSFLLAVRQGFPLLGPAFHQILPIARLNARLFFLALLVLLFWAGPNLWQTWAQQKEQMALSFKPEVEVLPGEY